MINNLIKKIFLLTGFSFGKKVVLGRTACLGKEIFSKVYADHNDYILINQQKVRVDLFLQLLSNNSVRPKSRQIKKYLTRKDVLPFIKEQQYLPWLKVKRDINFILIDSLSELVDQKFLNRSDGTFFCSYYSDVDTKNEEFNTKFDNVGLLDVGLIEKNYRDFFNWINKNYPGKPIIFINYSTKLDGREKFKNRQQEISRIIKILSLENKNIKNIELDDSLIHYSEGDDLPYHYSSETNLHYANQWKKVCPI